MARFDSEQSFGRGLFSRFSSRGRRRAVSHSTRSVVEAIERRLVLAATLPAGFAQSTITGGFGEPTDFAVSPSGQIFITEKTGAVRVFNNGVLQSTPFVSLNVDSYRDRGLDAVALDPNFATNGFVYLYYTKADPTKPNTAPNAAVNRLSRVTVNPANPNVAAPGSEVILLDNIPSNTGYHIGGLLDFGPDGKLYLGTGDGGVPFDAQTSGVPSYAQDLNSLGGKILRLNPDGSIPTDNPFVGQAGKRGEVYAYGMRNPFSGAIDPVTGKVFANDVGQAAWEEVDAITRGGNFGWPSAEGNSTNPAFINPLYTYAHDPSLTYSASVTGGLFYRGSTFPAAYQGQYFATDYIQGWMRVVNPTTGAITPFATGLNGVIRLEASADGGFYYLSHNDLAIYKVNFVGNVNRAPTAVVTATPTSGLAPLTVSFDGSGSSDPDGNALTYTWNFGDGTTGSGKTVTHTYTVNGSYVATLTVSDGSLTNAASPPTITVGAVAPTPVITSPSNNAPYTAGDTISFAGSATDAVEGALPASAFNWSVTFHHETHTHGFIDTIPGVKSGTFVIPTDGETDPVQWYEIKLTVKNSAGLTATTSVRVNPRIVNLTIAANVPGLTLNLDGQPITAPITQQAVAGLNRGFGAPSRQIFNGQVYDFVSWSDGGAANHTAFTPTTDVIYTANYQRSLVSLPFSGTPAALPGTLRMGEFDIGGEGASYHDLDPASQGTAPSYRPSDGVDLDASGDTGGGYSLGWVQPAEWVNYAVNVSTAGPYRLRARFASLGVGGAFHLNLDGAPITGAISVPDTGGWQTYQSVVVPGISLPAGNHVLRLVADTAGVNGFIGNIGSLAFTTAYLPSPAAVPGQIEAENYDVGGEGNSYHDIDPQNQGGIYRADGVDLEPTTDVGGGVHVGHISAGEWLEYAVNITAAGLHDLGLRFASGSAGGTAHIDVDGTAIGGSINLAGTGGWSTWQTVTLAGLNLQAGQHVLRLTFDTAVAGEIGILNWLKLTPGQAPPPPPAQTPFGGTAWAIPGQIEAENFDDGGEGIAYHDIDAANLGGAYRTTGVDVEPCTDTGGGFNVGHIAAGEWLEYIVNVAAAGLNDLSLRFASGSGGGTAHLEIDGAALGGSINLAGTGGWANWQNVTIAGLNLTAGQHVLRLAFDSAVAGEIGILNWLKLSTPTPTQTPFGGVSWKVPGQIQAENFDNGGEGIAFHDTTATNSGGQYRSTAVDIEKCTETGGGYDVTGTVAGEWLEYTVNLPSGGIFTLDTRVAAKGSNGKFHVEFDGVNQTGPLSVPNTGNWQSYQTVSKTGLSLTAGTHVIRLAMDATSTGGRVGSFNWIKLTATSLTTTALRSITTQPTTLSSTSGTKTRSRAKQPLASSGILSVTMPALDTDPGTTGSGIVGMTLVDRKTGQIVASLTDGQSIDLGALLHMKLRLVVDIEAGFTGSYTIRIDGKKVGKVSAKHYRVSLRGRLKAGNHELTVTLVVNSRLQGVFASSKAIEFTTKTETPAI